jgi:hypothetical protein
MASFDRSSWGKKASCSFMDDECVRTSELHWNKRMHTDEDLHRNHLTSSCSQDPCLRKLPSHADILHGILRFNDDILQGWEPSSHHSSATRSNLADFPSLRTHRTIRGRRGLMPCCISRRKATFMCVPQSIPTVSWFLQGCKVRIQTPDNWFWM